MERTLNPNHIPNSSPKLQTNDIKLISSECRIIISGEELCSNDITTGLIFHGSKTLSNLISVKYCFVLQSGLHFAEHISNVYLTLINILLIFICVFGFVYQVYFILDQYMLGKTVVNLEVKLPKKQPPPAITICIPEQISLTKLSKSSKFNEKLKSKHDDYMKSYRQSRNLDRNSNVNETTWKELKQRLLYLYLWGIKNEPASKPSTFDELNQLSIPHKGIFDVSINSEIEPFNKSIIHRIGSDYFEINEIPINSVGIVSDQLYKWKDIKCFTYFSALQEYWQTAQAGSQMIQKFEIRNDFKQYPPLDKYYIAIHSPNILPRFSEFAYFEIKPNEYYSVKYFQLKVELVLEGFESNCVEYDIRNKYGKIRMESDCRVYCIADFVKRKKIYDLPPSMLNSRSNDLIRSEVWGSFENKNTTFNGYVQKKVVEECSEKCKPDCNSKQFLTEVKVIGSEKPWVHWAKVEIQHNSIPDIIVRHSLEMTFMSFICNFGGLLGMWLGFSVLSISKDIFDSIRSLLMNGGKKSNLIFNNFNLLFKVSKKPKTKPIQKINNLPMVEFDL